MPCPHTSNILEQFDESRRSFMRKALAVGGASALSACVDRQGMPDVPQGRGAAALPARQHAWGDFLARDAHGNTILPTFQLVLLFDYAGDGPPSEAERRSVQQAFDTVHRAYEWGNGQANPYSGDGRLIEGALFMMGYSRRYFERFDADLPDSVDLPDPADTIDELDEESEPQPHDAALVAASDYAQVLLAIEQALYGNLDELNGVSVAGTLDGTLELADRRTGFKGRGYVAEKLDTEEVPRQSPSAMGYKSGFRGNQAPEDKVSIAAGPFTDGSTLHLSRVAFNLDSWYNDNTEPERINRMFSPKHDHEDVGDVGDFLAGDSGITRDLADATERHAEQRGVVGHTQKTARARDDSFDPRILRRSEGVSIDLNVPSLNFSSVQRGVEEFVKTRKAMNGDDLDLEDPNSGILDDIDVLNRGNYLLPPRDAIALPTPEGAGPT
ncbi:MAG: hypothetical protein ABEJ08_04295 [Halobacteriaceae archaeon]